MTTLFENITSEEDSPAASFITSGGILLSGTSNGENNSFGLSSVAGGGASGENPRTRDEDLAKLEVAVLACIFFVTVVGNFIVITGIYFRRQKMSRMYYFILHLSLADLITAFFNVGTQFVMELTWPEFLGGNVFCKVVKYLQILGPYSSSYVLVMTALDRYQAICYPMSNCNWTARQSKLMLGLAWGIAVLFCIPQIFVFSLEEVVPGAYDCWATFTPTWGAKAYVTWYSLSIFIVPLAVLVFAYTCICRAIWLNASMKNTVLRMEATSDLRRDHFNRSYKDTTVTIADTGTTAMAPTTVIANGNGNGIITNGHGRGPTHYETEFSHPISLNLNNQDKNKTNEWKNDSFRQKLMDGRRGKDELSSPTDDMEEDDSSSSSPTATHGGSRDEKSADRFHSILVNYRTNQKNSRPSVTAQIRTKIRNTWNRTAERKIENAERENNRVDKNSNNDDEGEGGAKQRLMPSGRNESSKSLSRVQILSTVNPKRASNSTSAVASITAQPRTHSVKGISRAKIKTVKLTVTVILCYFIASSPFIAAQLWSTYDPLAHTSPFYTGTVFTILTLLASLNSCVNPWIFLFFNPNLLQDFMRGCRGNHFKIRRRQSGASPVTGRTSTGPHHR